jgi:hypothetical protein
MHHFSFAFTLEKGVKKKFEGPSHDMTARPAHASSTISRETMEITQPAQCYY